MRVSVVVPVYQRPAELRRALRSLVAQTLQDFECIVIDDASPERLDVIVNDFDERFVYRRNARNGGPYNARTLGYEAAQGDYVAHLDSDDEAFPWMLQQAVSYLDSTPEVDAVAGMHYTDEGRLLHTIPERQRIVTPDDYRAGRGVAKVDCVGVVRPLVVEEWLRKRRDYYALEGHQWLTFSLRHSQLYVDEPWTRCHTDREDRVSQRRDPRLVDDFVKFLAEHEHLMAEPSPTLDGFLKDAYFTLRRARRPEANDAAKYLKARRVRLGAARRFARKARRMAKRNT